MRERGYRGTRAAVIGAAGFIGRWVARRLTEEGADLLLAVRDGEAAGPVFERYGVRGHAVAVDLEEPGAGGALIDRWKPEIVFNLAGYGVDAAERDEAQAQRMNAGLVEELAIACAQLPAMQWLGMRLVHAGSVAEYGAIGGVASEEREPMPDTLYGRTKLAGTKRLREICRERGLPAMTARLFQVVGPGEHEGRLLPTLLQQRGPLLFTDGSQMRDFTYVEDVAEGLLRLGKCMAEPGAVVNVATGRMTSIRSFVEQAAEALEIPRDRLRFGAKPDGRVMRYSAVSVELLRRLVGWVPEDSIGAMVRRTRDFLAVGAAEEVAR
jgi:nucleoside-diphosphate-sugar epimerase